MAQKAYSYIRFSTPEQLKGDSLRRQLEASEKYCKENNLILDESFQDLGKSSFHGINRTKGAFGKFLKLVEEGKINRGSILIVENLDRISREDVLTALTLFISMLEAGIKIITLQDKQIYSKESVIENPYQLIISISIMFRANEESKTKGIRIKKSWINKRTKALKENVILTGRCPDWLKLSDDKKIFIKDKKAINDINLIFDLKLAGKGNEAIANELNKFSLWKPKGRKGKTSSWRKSYIVKILQNRAVIGEFQPHIKEDGKRIKVGEVIKDYYPPIVPEDKFNRVQALIQNNYNTRGHAGGRNGKVSNLFGYMAECSKCGSPMSFVNKGDPPKGGEYLICDHAKRKLGCNTKAIRYDLVERNVLNYCIGLNVEEIISDDKTLKTELTELQNRVQAIEGELSSLEIKLVNVAEEIISTSNETLKITHRHNATRLAIHKDKLQKELEEKNIRVQELSSNKNTTTEQLKSVQELIDKMKELQGDERTTLRLNLRNQLRRLIRKMKIAVEMNNIYLFFSSGERRMIRLLLLDDSDGKLWDAGIRRKN